MKIKNISNLSKEELEYLYIEALNSLVDKNELTEAQKAQLLKYANTKLKAIEQGVFNAINQGFVTIEMLGGDLEFYLKKETAQPQRVIDWLIEAEHDLPPQPIVKQKPGPNGKLITFKNSETIEKIHSELKGYFPNKEAEFLKALQGEQLSELLLFPHNQNKFVEVFRRLKYNGFLLNTDTETKNWICTTFQFVKKGFADPQPFNESSVWDNLNKGKGEPTKKERICITEWLPYKSPLQLTRETKNEKL
jgi:hypothetical protein